MDIDLRRVSALLFVFVAFFSSSIAFGQTPVAEVFDDSHAIIGAIARTTFSPYACPAQFGDGLTVSLPSLWQANVHGDGHVAFYSTYHVGVMASLRTMPETVSSDDEARRVIAQWAESETIAIEGAIEDFASFDKSSKNVLLQNPDRRSFAFLGRTSGEIWRFVVVMAPSAAGMRFFAFQVPPAWFNAYLPMIEIMGQI